MPGKYPHTILSKLPRFRATSPGEELWLALRDLYALNLAEGTHTDDIRQYAPWLNPPGYFADYQLDVAITTASYRLVKAAQRVQKEAELSGESVRSHEGQLLIEDSVWEYMVEHMAFAALDPIPRRIIPHMAYKALLAANADIGKLARSISLEDAQDPSQGDVRCYCCGDQLWSPSFETPLRDIALDHVWPRSLGGVSTAENLLPICDPCNGAKEDRASWSVFGVVYDHAHAKRRDDRLLALALHRCAAGALAASKHLSLKEAFKELGPQTRVEQIDDASGWHFFNLRAHDPTVISLIG